MQESRHHADEALKLARNLTRELFQTENSAFRHGRREAERQVAQSGPHHALLALCEHARDVLPELPELARRNGLPVSSGGRLVGRLFSEARDKAFDLVISAERSYRGTLLGARHGLDVVRSLRAAAREAKREDLAAWCSRWLEHREPLVAAVERELQWFAQHPREALASARAGGKTTAEPQPVHRAAE